MDARPFYRYYGGWNIGNPWLRPVSFIAQARLNLAERVNFARHFSTGQGHDRRNHPTKRPSSRRVRLAH
jgi:hypothetical protein